MIGGKVESWCGERSLPEYVKKHAKDMPGRVAVNYYGREVSFNELDEASDRLATAIANMGYKKGDRIGAFLQTSPQCYILCLAAMKLGLISVPIDPMHRKLELEYFLKDSGTTLVATMDQMYPVVKDVRDECGIKDVIVTSFHDFLPEKPAFPLHPMMEPKKQTFPDTHEFLKLLEEHPPNPPKVNVELSDNAWILYTGGTTGLPKGCLHSHYNSLLCEFGMRKFAYGETSKDDVFLASWPHTHISGIAMCILATFYIGWTVIPLARWDAEAAMEAIHKYRVTLVDWSTPQYLDVINHPEVKNYDLSSIRVSIIIPFALPFTPDIDQKWRETTGCPIYQWGYASSEIFDYGAYGVNIPFKPGFYVGCGVLAPGVKVKIVDFESREEAAIGQEGEILIKSPAMLKEYWNKPEINEKEIVNGWLHTGDRGKIDEEGLLYFIGREKDVIKVSGYTVALKEVEMLGLQNPVVDKIAVIGVPDPKKGEIPKAFITLKPGVIASASDIEKWFKENVAVYKRPVVEIRKELPISAKGEILKGRLKEEELGKPEFDKTE